MIKSVHSKKMQQERNYQEVQFNENELKVMRRPGIEPGPPAWQARIVPLNHRVIDSYECITYI